MLFRSQKLGRTLKEKAAKDLDRLKGGTEKTRETLSVVDELLAFWSLEDADDTLEELEDILITADFGPATAFKVRFKRLGSVSEVGG